MTRFDRTAAALRLAVLALLNRWDGKRGAEDIEDALRQIAEGSGDVAGMAEDLIAAADEHAEDVVEITDERVFDAAYRVGLLDTDPDPVPGSPGLIYWSGFRTDRSFRAWSL